MKKISFKYKIVLLNCLNTFVRDCICADVQIADVIPYFTSALKLAGP